MGFLPFKFPRLYPKAERSFQSYLNFTGWVRRRDKQQDLLLLYVLIFIILKEFLK